MLNSTCQLKLRLNLITILFNSGSGYQSIGSFHGDNIEYLTALSDEEYVPPKLPFEVMDDVVPRSSTSNNNKDNDFDWGDEFMIDRERWTFLNHGAFGAALKCGHVRANQWREFQELQPLRFFDRYLLPHVAHSNRVLAKFIGADSPRSTVLIQNVTSGMNSVLSGYARNIGGPVILFDVAYGSVKKMLLNYCGNEKVFDIKLSSFPTPLSRKLVEESFIRSLENIKHRNGGNLSGGLLVLDHITSNTAMLMPIERLAQIAKREKMLVAVDGAHGLLSLDLNMRCLSKNGIDFYVTNAHKWLSCPRGAAILHCNDSALQESILRQPAIISHGIDDGFLSRFVWDGCRDFGALLAIPPVVDFWQSKETASIRSILKNKLENAIAILSASWHHGKDPVEYLYTESDMQAPTMSLVRLPDSLSGNDLEKKTSTDAKAIQDFLYNNMIEVPIKCIAGCLYVRISCHVYNEQDEYRKLAEIMKNIK